jgi:ribosomal-protein-alanine N-acetyltransferase
LQRVVATTTYNNAASIRVMQKLGMTIERNPLPDPPWFQVVGVLESPSRPAVD